MSCSVPVNVFSHSYLNQTTSISSIEIFTPDEDADYLVTLCIESSSGSTQLVDCGVSGAGTYATVSPGLSQSSAGQAQVSNSSVVHWIGGNVITFHVDVTGSGSVTYNVFVNIVKLSS